MQTMRQTDIQTRKGMKALFKTVTLLRNERVIPKKGVVKMPAASYNSFEVISMAVTREYV